MRQFLTSLQKKLPPIPLLRFHIQEPGCNGYDFHYHFKDRAEYVIGRVANQCGLNVVQIQLQDKLVSRNHCRIFLHPQGFWMIEDLGSVNGTYIRLPETSGEHWQRIHFATPLPMAIDIRVGITLLAMRPIIQGPNPTSHTRKLWRHPSKQAA